MAIPYIVEVRETGGDLVSVLGNASNIHYTQKINAAHSLSFLLPSDDSKLADVTLARELWLRNYDTDTVARKFRLQKKWDIRVLTKLVTQIEALDYMSQLGKSKIIDYIAGVNMLYLDMTAAYGGTVFAIDEDDTHVFAGGFTTDKVYKYLKSDMSKVDESVDYGGTIYAIAVDDTHVYVGGDTTKKVSRYLKSDMSYVDQTVAYPGEIRSLAIDATHLYVCGGWDAWPQDVTVRKYLLTDMSYVDESSDYGSRMHALVIDATHIYAGGETNQTVNKYLKTDMSDVDASADYGGTIYDLVADDDNVYAGGATTQKVNQILKSDMSLVAQSPDYGGTITALAIATDSIYVYAIGATTQRIRRYATSDMGYNDQSPDYLGVAWALAADSEHAFTGGATVEKVYKYSLFDTIEEIIDALLSYTMQTPVITKGTIDAIYADAVRNIRADDKSILTTLIELQGMVGGYLEVTNARELDWSETIGDDTGQQIRYGKNLIGIERETDYTGLFNRIYVFGYNPTTGVRIKLSEIQTNDYVENATSQTTWSGIYIGSFINFSITSAATLLEWANELLTDHSAPVISYRINTLDLSAHSGFDFEVLKLGSTVTVIDEDLGIDVEATVVRIEHPDLLNPQMMMVELANVTRNIGDTITQLQKQQSQIGAAVAAA